MQPLTLEENLIQGQLQNNASIFACNYFAIISPKRVLVGKEKCGEEVWTWENPVEAAHMGHVGIDGENTDSFLNTRAFIQAWRMLIKSNVLWGYDWSVKVDPDAIFFPNRLRDHVRPHNGKEVYVANCNNEGPKLYGAVEVFSKQAMRTYEKHVEECMKLNWHIWGEDFYMQTCLNMVHVGQIQDYNLVGDQRCVAAACTDASRVAYHPYKDPSSYWQCWEQSPK